MEFINKLSFEKLRTVLNMCGLFLIDDEKYFNDMQSESNKGELDCYYIRALDTKRGHDENQHLNDKITKEITNKFSKNIELDRSFWDFSYSNDNAIDIYSVSDFLLARAFPIEFFNDKFPNKRDLELQEKFISVMANTFKNQNYQNKYDEFVNNELTKDNEISQEK